jgi:hypothetical protein
MRRIAAAAVTVALLLIVASANAATAPEKNAIRAARSYLSISAFSKLGLIQQLSSSAGSGYPHKVAVYAVDSLHENWDNEAVKAAKSYLKISAFSCSGMIQQLSSSAGAQFTVRQAEYGAKKAGVC